ncbi:MAG TPA: FG-GAP-like repeat-containing protein [Pyrinomonadaceae bacterium]|jgi:hypothetical protein
MKIDKRKGCSLVVLFLIGLFGVSFTAAQTCDVTWRKADNPRVISGTVTIPAGQTVCAEPGVIVQSASGAQLDVYGNLLLQGTAAEPVVFSPVTNTAAPGAAIRIAGKLDAQFADISISVTVGWGGTLLVRNSRFRERGLISTIDFLVAGFASRFISIQDTVFDSDAPFQANDAGIYVDKTTLVLRNVTFRNGASAGISESNLFIDNFIGQNLKYSALRLGQFYEQPQFLDTLNITGSLKECIFFNFGNYEIGANNVLQGCQYPVKGTGGIMPGSVLPTSGNQNNWFEGSITPQGIYAPIAVPYVMNGGRVRGTEILPGTTFKLKPNTAVDSADSVARVLGLPTAPITFEPWLAGQKWDYFALNTNGDKVEYVVFDGMKRGISSDNIGGTNYYIDQSVLRNSDIAVDQPDGDLFYMEGNLFANNAVAVNATKASSGFRLNGVTNPNLFENNTIAVRSTNGANPDVRNNWWNSPTGPTTPQNPGGTGDRIEGNAQFQPFRTVRPDRTDHPPVVRLTRRPFQITGSNFDGVFEPGQKIILTWNAFDNASIVKQRIQIQATRNDKETFTIVADNIPGNQRSYEFTVPNNNGSIVFIRIVATDNIGQEGWDEWQVRVQNPNETGALQFTTPLAGQTFLGGTDVQLKWQITAPFNSNIFTVYLLLDGHRKAINEGSGNQTGSLGPIRFPFVSTDSARFAVHSSNHKWFYSEPFSIRPDPRFPDAPPTVSLTSPQAGQVFPAGGIVPISWTAADDEALRGFSILYSTDGGKMWITLTENLPPSARSYSWQLPPGTGFQDTRVRVVAFDKRFQNSSDGYNRSFRTNGAATIARRPLFDFDGDGKADVSVFRPSDGVWYLNRSQLGFTAVQFGVSTDKIVPADFDGDGKTDVAVYRGGNWYYLQSSDNQFRAVQFGAAGDVPQAGDFDGDGKADFVVFRPSDGTWYLMQSAAGFTAAQFGQNGDKPVADDFDGDGKFDIAVYRAGTWYMQRSRDGFAAAQFGISSDRPTPADYDGDGKADLAVYRGGNWYIQQSRDGFVAAQFGIDSDIPTPADYDGDGKTDFAVFRGGTWYLSRSSAGFAGVQFGVSTDVPVPASRVP